MIYDELYFDSCCTWAASATGNVNNHYQRHGKSLFVTEFSLAFWYTSPAWNWTTKINWEYDLPLLKFIKVYRGELCYVYYLRKGMLTFTIFACRLIYSYKWITYVNLKVIVQPTLYIFDLSMFSLLKIVT